MPFCPNCGTQTGSGRFCPNCGADVGVSAAGTGAAPSGSFSAAGLTDNVASALCYLLGFISGVIFLLIEPYRRNRLVRFHAWQSIFASLGLLVIQIVLGIVTGMLLLSHAWWLNNLVWRLYDLAVLAGWLYMMYTAYNNQKVRLPVVGDLAEKRA